MLRPLPFVRQRVDRFGRDFETFFVERDFEPHAPVELTSRLDPTTLFVGSTISVFKPSLLRAADRLAPAVLVQEVLRTQNLRCANIDARGISKTSLFLACGLVGPLRLLTPVARACQELMQALFDDRLVITVWHRDADLVNLVRGLAHPPGGLRMAVSDETPFRHAYGQPELTGRNYNYGVRGAHGAVTDVANLIVLQVHGEEVAFEFGLGASTSLQHQLQLDHAIQAAPIAAHVPLESPLHVKLADYLAAAIALRSEGLRPNASSRGKVLRSYMRAIARLQRICGLGDDDLHRGVEGAFSERHDPACDAHRFMLELHGAYNSWAER